MYKIEQRYQYRNREGFTWTKWFPYIGFETDDKKVAEEEVKALKEFSKEIDRRTKTKHEYQIIET